MKVSSYLEKILSSRVYEAAVVTPVSRMTRLSDQMHNHILLKREDQQPVFSFKVRGAYNKIASLSPEQQQRGVIAASAGNHAQGVALAGHKLGLQAIIVMPRATPAIKVDAVRALGAEVQLVGETFEEAAAYAREQSEMRGMAFVHPYDDPLVIAGQGTIGMELLQQVSEPMDAVFLPVGGGGLIAGVAACLKQTRPETRIIGVEPEDSACLHAALAAKERITLPQVNIFAEGVATTSIGEENFRLAQLFVDEVVTVNTDEICAAIKDIFDDVRCIAEPSGAIALAGIKKYIEREQARDQNLVGVLSGANVDFHRLRHVSERSEAREKSEALLAVQIPEEPGSFLSFCEALNHRNLTEFNYRYQPRELATIFVGVSVKKAGENGASLCASLQKQGYHAWDLSHNDMAMDHLRHMVGGTAPDLSNERLFRFQFPERPGALRKFLTELGARWNISLFHYRNHGAAYGRVLCAFQVPEGEQDAFSAFLDDLGYAYWEETDNPAYPLFLAAGCFEAPVAGR
ncbi:threonine ammonia-lyase, biosynthetic [Acanthopleuribacter pedis]|uniref:L-threonine dehydratase n=1 Tax=Acanthopleuribacter pedis TaxID=442870 RepID=A0A8J7Q5U4_9BACT|nr:threonine ammonia-lyase, biosynthetic [Acanthopleuribacter pedis]MBO1318687.1 threonine ammonia-lyase, biosynthetic [Acanthopleuribacter pedis]